MVEFCSICSSLIINSQCSNKNCGVGSKPEKKKRTKAKKKDEFIEPDI